MASFVKYQDFVEQLGLETHQLNTDALHVTLSNTAINVAHTQLSQVGEIATGNGFTQGGEDTLNSWSESGGTATCAATDVTFTASGGAIAQFQYVILFNQTATNDELIGSWDYGSAVDLANGESFKVDFTTSSFTLA